MGEKSTACMSRIPGSLASDRTARQVCSLSYPGTSMQITVFPHWNVLERSLRARTSSLHMGRYGQELQTPLAGFTPLIMRIGIASLRSPYADTVAFDTLVHTLEFCCDGYGESSLWPEESHCPYRQECTERFDWMAHIDLKPHKRRGGAMSTTISKLYYTVRDTAALLGVRQSHVLKLIRSKKLKGEKHGWVWAIPAEELKKYQESTK